MTTLSEVAYAAGLFDGEGCIWIKRRAAPGCCGDVYALTADVSQDDPRPLTWLAERWGGQARPRSVQLRANRIAHRWYASGPTAAAFLRDVLPYLIVKHEQAVLAVEFQERHKNPGRRGLTIEQRSYCASVKEQIHLLNRGEHMAGQHPGYEASEQAGG